MKPIINRFLSAMLSVAVLLNAIPISSVNAEEITEPYPYTLFAASSNEGAITIDASNACINGNIATNGTIVSNGNFNVNGTKTENVDESMIVIFEKIENQYFVNNSVEEYESDYSLEETNIHINVPTEVQGEALLTGNININTAFKAFDDISLSGDVKNTNDSVIFSQNGNIVIDSQNVNLNGLVYAPYGCVDINAQNLNMNSVVIIADSISISCPNLNANYNSNMARFVGVKSEVDNNIEKFIILSGEYNEADDTIDMMWYTNSITNLFELYCSNDGVNYSLIDSTDTIVYQYSLEDDFDVKYFKVVAIEENSSIIESDPFSVILSKDGYIIKYIDSDDDGLQDSSEKIYGTDPENPDSDSDNLPDGYEVLNLRTDPTIPDTDDNGVTDDLENFDEDDLNNYDEMLLGTDPFLADTDDDELKDCEEANYYGTDPLDPDTDNDGILDVDEINFNLNPNDSSDVDTPIQQVLNEEDLRVNKYNADFNISMDVEASNNVKRYLKQSISRYAGIISDNRAIIGCPINIEYNAGTIYSGSIKFKLENKLINDSPAYYSDLNLGIERYGVFIYDEEVGTIIPVSCEYNIDDNSLTIDANIMGDLMIIDYEALLYDLGVTPDKVREAIDSYDFNMEEDEESSEEDAIDDAEVELLSSELLLQSPTILSDTLGGASSGPRQIELVLVIDTTGSMNSQISTVKNNLNNLITKLYDAGITQYTSVITFGDITNGETTLINNNVESAVQFNNNPSVIQSIINNIKMCSGGDELETPIDGLGMANSLSYANNRSKYLFLITDVGYKRNNNYGYSDMKDVANALLEKGIYASIITGGNKFSAYKDLTYTTGGIEISQNGNFCDDMYNFITRSTPRVSVIVANNLVTGCFEEDLVKGGNCDTDKDGKTDSAEINWKYIKVNKDGSYTYPTWEKLCKKSAYKSGKKNKLYKAMKDIEVIPALSNPFSKDTDGDYYLDSVDDKPLEKDDMYINDAALDDEDFHRGNIITEKPSKKTTDGIFVADNTAQTAKYVFTRSSNVNHFFTITPKRDSFYKFYNGATKLAYVDISHEKGIALWKETIYDSPDSEGVYFLEKGVEYRIDVYGYNKGDYEFSIEQDNWVFAQYGGYEHTEHKNGYFSYEAIYIDDESVYKIIKEARNVMFNETIEENLEKYFENHRSPESNKIPEDVFYNMCNRDAALFIDMQVASTDDINGLIGELGNIASISGVLLLLRPELQLASTAVTLVGGASAVYCGITGALPTMKDRIRDAMIEGKYNIKIDTATSTYHPHTDDFEFSASMYHGWTEDSYIYKFMHDRTKKDKLIPFDDITVAKYENGEWSYE